MSETEYYRTLTKAISALHRDGISVVLINKMTDAEILRSFEIDDYAEYNRYIVYLCKKYDV